MHQIVPSDAMLDSPLAVQRQQQRLKGGDTSGDAPSNVTCVNGVTIVHSSRRRPQPAATLNRTSLSDGEDEDEFECGSEGSAIPANDTDSSLPMFVGNREDDEGEEEAATGCFRPFRSGRVGVERPAGAEDLELVEKWSFHYLNAEKVRAAAAAVGDDHGGQQERARGATAASELQRVSYFAMGKLTELTNTLQGLRRPAAAATAAAAVTEYEGFSHDRYTQLDNVGEEVALLERFAVQNARLYDELKLVGGGGDTRPTSTGSDSPVSKAQQLIFQIPEIVRQLVVQISRMREEIDTIRSGSPPLMTNSFERVTKKYWVETKHVTALKLQLLKQVPIFEITKKSPDVELDFERGVATDLQQHNYISSVYMDTDNLGCYHKRVVREDGAWLMRVRWYGGGPPSQSPTTTNLIPTCDPTINRFVFVERKVHREGDKSTKDRFKIERRLLPQYMLGTLDLAATFKSMVRDGEMKAEDVSAALELARSCQEQIVQLKLKPKIRTSYYRTAFQNKNNNEVRLTLDTPLYVFREREVELTEADLSDFWGSLEGPPQLETFEYGVLEVKTAEEPPEWVETVLDHNAVIFAGKFSKFQHGVITSLQDEVQIVPFWIDEVQEERADDKPLMPLQFRRPVSPTSALSPVSKFKKLLEESDDDAIHAAHSTITAALGSSGGGSGGGSGLSELFHQAPTSTPGSAAPPYLPPQQSSGGEGGGGEGGSAGGRRRGGGEGGDSGSRGTSGGGSSSGGNSSGGNSSGGGGGGGGGDGARNRFKLSSTNAGGGGGGGGDEGNGGASLPRKNPRLVSKQSMLTMTGKTKVKVEPKTYFANERTFIQWIGSAILLTTFCGQMMTTNESGRLMGTILWVLGLAMVVYALVQYNWRLNRIDRQDPRGYSDRYGPTVLAVIVAIMMVTIIVVAWSIDFADNDDDDNGSSSNALDGSMDNLNLNIDDPNGTRRARGITQHVFFSGGGGGGGGSQAVAATGLAALAGGLVTGARGVVVWPDSDALENETCDYEAAAGECPAVFNLGLNRPTSSQQEPIELRRPWPKQAFKARLGREKAIDLLEQQLHALVNHLNPTDSCVDISAVMPRTVVDEWTESSVAVGEMPATTGGGGGGGGQPRLVFHNEATNANAWLERDEDAAGSSPLAPSATPAAFKWVYGCGGNDDDDDDDGTEVWGEARQRAVRLVPMTIPAAQDLLAEHGIPGLGLNSDAAGAIAAARPLPPLGWKQRYFANVSFRITIAGSPAQVALKIEYPSAMDRAFSKNAGAVALSLELINGGTTTARFQAMWLLGHLSVSI